MKENNKEFIEIFSEMDNESNKVTGVVSTLFAIGDAMGYGTTDPHAFTEAINLAATILQDYKETNEKLITEGYEMVKLSELEKQK